MLKDQVNAIKKNKSKLREKNIVAAIVVIILTATVMVCSYAQISKMTEQRCYDRIQEIVNTVTDEISSQLIRDSYVLSTVAEVVTYEDEYTPAVMQPIMRECDTITPTTKLYMLLPGNLLVSPDTKRVRDLTGRLSFEEIASKGESVTGRVRSIFDDGKMVMRHYLPIVKEGETVAILVASTDLEELPDALNIEYTYNGTTDMYLVDRNNGDLLMDTLHDELGNLNDFGTRETKRGDTSEEFIENILDGDSGYTIYKSTTMNEYLYFYYEPMVNKDNQTKATKLVENFTICISVPERVVFANLYAIRKVCIIMLTVEIIMLLLYLVWAIHNTSVTLEKAVLEERLVKAENAERAKTMFLSNMSHDIRTPMNAIIGYTTLAAANLDNKERMQDYLSKILSSSNHLLSLINDVLDMSRIESGKVNIEETECSLPDMLHDLRNILQSQVQAKQLDFFIDTIDVLDEDVFCDKLHLNQVLLNLLSNAIKFTPAGGSVSLIFKQKHGAPEGYAVYEIRVKDTGIGMSKEFAEHVFEPFEREKTSTISGIQGTGLGMAIAKNIVDMMGGTIEVFSEQGKGTEFVLTLELRLQSERKQIEVIKELEGLRALVVDDDYTICDSVAKMLVQLGMRADWTMSGKEAVLHAKHAFELADEFNAYIIDWQLPDMNGVETVRRIRAVIGDDVPIIILTAYDWTSIEDEAREAGVTAFCNKPIFLSGLRDALLNVIGKPNPVVEEAAAIPATSDSLQGKRILLVEDNELNREIAYEILTESGFVIETAENGQVAVDMVQASKDGYYDLILMDVQMPVMNGYEATRSIRGLTNPALANIPIIAMTANAFNEDKMAALEAGMNDHTAKPIDMVKLFEVLQKHLGN